MAEAPYTFTQFAADLARLGFSTGDQLTPRGLSARHRKRMEQVHPDRQGGSEEQAKELNAARDRLRAWHDRGRPRFADDPAAQPAYGDPASAARAAGQRQAEREARYQAEQAAAAERVRREAEERESARQELERIFFWRRWRRRAMLPLRAAWRAFAHMPIDRMPWAVGAILFVLGWPFVQDSRLGPYVPHFPSIYTWLYNTDAMAFLRDPGNGHWVNHAPSLDSPSNRNRRCSGITRECWYVP